MTGSHLITSAEQHLREITIIEYASDGCPSDTHHPPPPGHPLRPLVKVNPGKPSRWGVVIANGRHWWAFKHEDGDAEQVVGMNQTELARFVS